MKTFVGALILGIMTTSTAFAAANYDISPINLTDEDYAQMEEMAQADYISKEGIVASVEKHEDYYTIEVKNLEGDEIEMIYNVSPDTYTISQTENGVVSLSEIKEGMRIAAVLSKNAPMTMSLPAQASDVTAFVILGEGSVNVSQFNNELINAENTLQLNISEETNILNINGTRMILSAEDIKNENCIVLYTMATRSIPAQTVPETVVILENLDEMAAMDEISEDTQHTPVVMSDVQDSYVELRKEAEAKGYKVEWSGNKKPIVLTKDDMRVEITQGSADFNFTHNTRDIKALDRMEKMSMSVKLENNKTMVAKSFIDALE